MKLAQVLAAVAFAIGTAGSAVAQNIGCVDNDPMPDTPPPGSTQSTLNATYGGTPFSAVFWRQSCGDHVRLFLRVTPSRTTINFFVCTTDYWVVVLGGATRIALVQSWEDFGPYCGAILRPQTFGVAKYTSENFDSNLQLILAFAENGNGAIFSTTLPARGASTDVTPENGLWWNPAEPGTGYTIAVRNGTLVMVVYSFKTDGEPQWYLTAGPLTNGNRNYTGTLERYRGGQCISCAHRGATVSGNDGAVSITFSSGTSATLSLPGGRVTTIQPMQF